MSGIGALSYGAGAIASLALAIVLAIGWRGRLAGTMLLAAALVNTAWAGLFVYSAWHGLSSPLLLDLADVVRYGAWFAFLLVISLETPLRSLVRVLTGVAVALCALQAALVVFDVSYTSMIGRSIAGAELSLIAAVSLPIFGLMIIEQLCRGTTPQTRHSLKYLCIGLGGLFAYDLFVYSEALLLKRIDADLWLARGSINALVMPLIAIAAARNPSWSLDVYVSRRAVLHTASLVGAGGYLLAMAAAGYYIRVYGGSWGGVAQAAFLFGAGLVLLLLLFSSHLRAKARVLLSKHFFNYKYDYREEWLRFTRTLSGGADEPPLAQRVLQAIAQLVDSPGGALWQLRNGRFEPTATWDFTIADGHRFLERPGDRLTSLLAGREWVVDLDEWRAQPGHYDGELGAHWLAEMPAAWLVVPLMYRDELRAFVVLARPPASLELNWEDHDVLKTAGRQAASYLAQEEAAQALSEMQRFEAFSKLSAFVVHDIKNVVNQLNFVMRNAERHKDNPAFVDDAVRTVENAVARMNHLMTQLRAGDRSGERRRDELVAMLQRVARGYGGSAPVPELSSDCDELTVMIDGRRFETILEHLVQNAKDATPADGHVELRLHGGHEEVLIEVIDSGMGMSREFVRDRLFRPFDTTKGSKGMGIGAYEAREFVNGLGGRLDVFSRQGKGTRIEIRLPGDLRVAPSEETILEMAR